VRYRPLETACAACHADPHLGQLGPAGCDRCHGTDAFSRTRFDHNDRDFTTFALSGGHAKVACDACHKLLPLPDGGKVRRYRPLPRDCEACHADFHRGQFRALAPTPSGRTRCALCHAVNSWDDGRFPHDQTGFPLTGQHRRVACKSCHPSQFTKRLPDRCAGCHRDAHAGEFGQRCEGCHEVESWKTTFSADAHRATNFPLTGRHALIPCTECHPQVRDRNFAHTALKCVSCHQADYDRAAMTAIDHQAAGFSTECRQCHSTTRFSPARYPDHDRCFRISGGAHAGIRCRSCHSAVPPPQSLGACASNTAACTSCHAHPRAKTDAIHATLVAMGVAQAMGYDYADAKCVTCHRGQ
jgi:hypothetical protein